MTTTVYGNLPDPKFKGSIISSEVSDTVFGVKYPLYDNNNSAKGIYAKTAGLELLKSQVRQFVRTERGERVMLPNFGLSLKRFLFEQMTGDIKAAIASEIKEGLALYVPNAIIRSLSIVDGDNVTGLGLPGIKISLLISPRNSSEKAIVEINL